MHEVLDLKIRENELEVVQSSKYLGVKINRFLDWKEQIMAVSAKVSRALDFLKHTKSFLTRETLRTLYIGIVEPYFRYCNSVWSCACSTEIKQLQKLQNHAARIDTNSSYDAPSRPLLEGLGWKTIDELISNEFQIMVYKSLNGLGPQYLCNVFTKNSTISTHSLHNARIDLRLPLKRTTNGQKCLSYRQWRRQGGARGAVAPPNVEKDGPRNSSKVDEKIGEGVRIHLRCKKIINTKYF